MIKTLVIRGGLKKLEMRKEDKSRSRDERFQGDFEIQVRRVPPFVTEIMQRLVHDDPRQYMYYALWQGLGPRLGIYMLRPFDQVPFLKDGDIL